MRAILSAVLLALGTTAPASPQQLPSGELPEQRFSDNFCGIKADTVTGFRAAALGDWKPLITADPTRYEAFANERSKSVLSFTKSGHSAHPAAVCRSVVPNAGSGSTINMSVQCEASKSACDQLVRDFAALNNAIPKQ